MENIKYNNSEEYLQMDLSKSDLFLEILSFLEGVSKFLEYDLLDTGSLSDEEKTKLNTDRRSLQCKSSYLWKVFNLSMQGTSEQHSYLNMEKTGNKTIIEDRHEEQYDYCAFETRSEHEQSLDCPYSKLSTTDAFKKNPAIEGDLIQMDRRSFFGKPKMTYVILLDKWLLTYSSRNEKRPLQCILCKTCDKLSDEEHTNAFKIVSQINEKPFVFQATTKKETDDWITGIECSLKPKRVSHGYVNVDSSKNRRLPTPPGSAFRKSNKSDDIYEEPDLVNNRKSVLPEIDHEIDKKMDETKQIVNESTYDNVDHCESPAVPKQCSPELPVKMRTFGGPIVCPNYDVPKNNRLVLVEDKPSTSGQVESKILSKEVTFKDLSSNNNQNVSDEVKNNTQQIEKQEKEQTTTIKLEKVSSSKPIPKKELSSVVQNTEEIKAKLEQQGIILTPILAHPSTSPTKTSKFLLLPSKDIKNWFRTKLNRSPDKEKRKSTPDTESILKASNTSKAKRSLSNDAAISTKPSIISKSSGSKVNMIIHQLEANGHLQHLLTKSKLHRRHTIVDDSYEFVCHEVKENF